MKTSENAHLLECTSSGHIMSTDEAKVADTGDLE